MLIEICLLNNSVIFILFIRLDKKPLKKSVFMRVCEVKNHFNVYQNYTFLSTTVYIATKKVVQTIINHSKIKVFAWW